MPISSINRIKTIANKLGANDNLITTIYENNGLRTGSNLIPKHEIISFNCFLKNLRAFALIKSLSEVALPNFTLDDSETDKLYKTLNIEWSSARKQLTLYISNQTNTTSSGEGWYKVGSISLLNPSGYPYRMYNLMDIFTDSLTVELGDNGKIGIQVEDVGYGLLDATDEVTIHGSYLEEIFVQSPDPTYVNIINSSGASTPPPVITPISFPVSTLFRVSASDIQLNDNDLVSTWIQPSASNLIVSQDIEASQPTFKTNVLNGKSAVYFQDDESGISKFLSITESSDPNAPLSLIPVAADWLIFIVAKFEGSFDVGLTNFTFRETQAPAINIGGGFTNVCYYNPSGDFTVARADTEPGEWKIYVLCRRYNSLTLYMNGITYPLDNIDGTISTDRDFLDTAFIGRGTVAQANDMTGFIADVGIMHDYSTSDINAIGQYFKTLYNLTWNDI